jgi:hypothetical protein
VYPDPGSLLGSLVAFLGLVGCPWSDWSFFCRGFFLALCLVIAFTPSVVLLVLLVPVPKSALLPWRSGGAMLTHPYFSHVGVFGKPVFTVSVGMECWLRSSALLGSAWVLKFGLELAC